MGLKNAAVFFYIYGLPEMLALTKAGNVHISSARNKMLHLQGGCRKLGYL